MREIKAPRAWYKPLNVMIQPENVESINFETKVMGVYMKGKGFHVIRLSDVELMWPTGLKDKNGKEIYEGDLLSDVISNSKSVLINTIIFEDGAFKHHFLNKWTAKLRGNDKDYMFGNTSIIFEVIGNVWEHPHLLEGRDEA